MEPVIIGNAYEFVVSLSFKLKFPLSPAINVIVW